MRATVADPVAQASRDQAIVSDPGASAWVDASAGAGKTKVLTDRALRLMLAYNAPDRILCLTFTKAAAAEMANRIVRELAAWATAPADGLARALLDLTGRRPGDGMLARARALFAAVVDAPGGLKVQTVHAFCQSALERFPIEAGAPPGFAALDERGQADLMTEARDRTLAAAMAADPVAPLARALDRMALRGAEDALDAILRDLLSERARLKALGGADGAAAAVFAMLDIADEAAADAALTGPIDPPADIVAGLGRLAEAYADGRSEDVTKHGQIAGWLALSPTERKSRLSELLAAFFTENGDGDARSRAATAGVKKANAWFDAVHGEMLAYVEALRDDVRRATSALDTVAAVRLAADVEARYERMKRTRAALDFDDLILMTRDLLQSDGGAGWALYKLDQGVDHILVDEAQDTNPEQWQIVHALAGEFFQTDGADDRTVFAVGDPKQSIFSFQRADPNEFARSKAHFEAAAAAAKRMFHPRPLAVSFRSVPAVLHAVDATFAATAAAEGLAPDNAPPEHTAARTGLPGRVEFWPLTEPATEAKGDIWDPLTDYPEGDAKAEVRLADDVANEIAALIADPDARVGATAERPQGRRIVASDVMVVVQHRAPFADALARALKARNVATAGVDRMRLSRQLAVRDLMALAQAATLPEDDLAVACLLKSPLCNLTESTLFDLAYGRGRLPLWLKLKQAATAPGAAANVAAAWTLLRDAMAQADFRPPFDFFQWALGPMQGRARLIAAMGAAVADPIDEFVALALRYAGERPASLTGFLTWVDRDQADVKRELEGPAAGVRLLTAHSAKGLQAPVVFLPDTARAGGGRPRRLFWPSTAAGPTPLLGAARQKLDCAAVRQRRQTQEAADAAERRRLLYVAMTRAEDRLYVVGWRQGRGRSPGCWHELVEDGFARLRDRFGDMVREALADDGDGPPRLVFDDPGAYGETAGDADIVAAPAGDRPSRPDWLDRPAPRSVGADRTLAPSTAAANDGETSPPALSPLARGLRRADAAVRFGRGLLIHKLLERLPAVTSADRRRVGAAFLDRAADLPPSERDRLLAAVTDLLDAPVFGAVFAPETLAEAPIAGEIGGRRYAGVIDRLALGPDRALIVDFKTNRPPPQGPDGTPPAYLRQMALYRALARQAFPNRTVATAILWTEAPRLDPLADALLDPFAPDAETAALMPRPQTTKF